MRSEHELREAKWMLDHLGAPIREGFMLIDALKRRGASLVDLILELETQRVLETLESLEPSNQRRSP